MAVNGFARGEGSIDFSHHLGVAVEYAGIVHEFAQEVYVVAFNEFFHSIAVEGVSAGLDVGRTRGYARGTAKGKVEARMARRFKHQFDAYSTYHIGNFVGIAYCAHGSVRCRDTGKLHRHHHRTLHMHVAVDEARHVVGRFFGYVVLAVNGDDSPLADSDDTAENFAVDYIHNVSPVGAASVVVFLSPSHGCILKNTRHSVIRVPGVIML